MFILTCSRLKENNHKGESFTVEHSNIGRVRSRKSISDKEPRLVGRSEVPAFFFSSYSAVWTAI